MPRLVVITDVQGNVLGTVRADSIRLEGTEDIIQFQPVESDEYRYHELEVADDLMQQSPERVHEEVAAKLRR